MRHKHTHTIEDVSGGGAGGDAIRIGPPVGTELGAGTDFLDDPFGVQTDETLG